MALHPEIKLFALQYSCLARDRTKSKPSAVKRPPRALGDHFGAEVLLILYCCREPVKSRLGSHAGAVLEPC